ncbi:hypothetical protein K437DRAFT_258667 [Tilletiaria anomala UBC 951]|uniref:Shr3 amino acid permease chaperone n=1 Tax=Tilletiaria anomala (strain ATCC 24038 / CBS 436.72 / UBC 951) TaxID=1037660 RepID=A0A066VJF9_TILAU|nr:uncharacterized protein K437DRAFT_258667 [Tilletiaria anomala UBC 951]KDN40443.1 hypothetical protein K437DRAFT_258667 [Tilletiaria anomala UBC 951]
MGGFTSVTVVASAVFLMGTLAMHWTADHLMLWQTPITRQSLLTAHEYYHYTFSDASKTFQSAIVGVACLGAGTAFVKILGGRESNWLFDGASLFLWAAIGVVLSQKVFPSIVALPPLLPLPEANPLNASDLLSILLRDLATANALIAAALVGVVLLQSGQYYSERLEERERMEELDARLRRRQRRLEHEAHATKEKLETAQTGSSAAIAVTTAVSIPAEGTSASSRA